MDAAGRRDGSVIVVYTLSAAVARSVVRLWHEEFGLPSGLSPVTPDSFGRSRYAVEVSGNRVLQAVEELRFARRGREAGNRNAYLRGAFQGAGSMVRPGREHHLEFVHREREFIERVVEFARAPLSITERRGRWVAYTKSSDGVTVVLSQMGLYDAVLEYEARSVVGEAKANANRVTNFDAANAGRTATAAARQLSALAALEAGELPQALREMLELRLEYPEYSLAELALLGGISKSAANHRLRRLLALAGE